MVEAVGWGMGGAEVREFGCPGLKYRAGRWLDFLGVLMCANVRLVVGRAWLWKR